MNKFTKSTFAIACLVGSLSSYAVTEDEIKLLPGSDKLTQEIISDISGSIDYKDEIFKVIIEYDSAKEDANSINLVNLFLKPIIITKSGTLTTVEAFAQFETIKQAITNNAFIKISAPYSGRGIAVAVFDSGIERQKGFDHIKYITCHYEHPIIKNGKEFEPTCSKDKSIIKKLTEGKEAPNDDWGSGTAIAGVLFSRAYQSQGGGLVGLVNRSTINIIDIVNSERTARNGNPIVDQAAYSAELVNISQLDSTVLSQFVLYIPPMYVEDWSTADIFDSSDCSNYPDMKDLTLNHGASTDAINRMINKGAIIVTSTGDEGLTGKTQFPACLPQVISVTGYVPTSVTLKDYTTKKSLFSYSSYGFASNKVVKDTIDITQNVSDITTISAPVHHKTFLPGMPNKPESVWSSNIAAAQVVGCIAQMKEKNPTLNQEAVKRYLQGTSSGYVHKEGDTDNYVPKMDCAAALEAVPEA